MNRNDGFVRGVLVSVALAAGGHPAVVAAQVPAGIALVRTYDSLLGLPVAVRPDGMSVYVTDGRAVMRFARDHGAIDGALSSGVSVPLPSPSPDGRALAISPGGEHLYVLAAQAGQGVLYVLALDANGTPVLQQTLTQGVGGVSGLLSANDIILSPDGEFAYVASSGEAAVAVFSRDVATGLLTFNTLVVNGVGGAVGLDSASRLAISPGGAHLYVTAGGVVGNGEYGISVFERNIATGALQFVEHHSDIFGHDLEYAGGVVVSPEGFNVYVGSPFRNRLAVFARDGGTGKLLAVEEVIASGDHLVITPDGTALFAGANDVRAFDRAPVTGLLTEGRSDFLRTASSLALSPDGANAYAVVVGQGGTLRLAAFQRVAVKCSSAPLVGCAAAKARTAHLGLKSLAGRQSIKWTWGAGSALPPPYGDFTTTTDGVLCVYDGSPGLQPFLQATLPAGALCKGKPCWKAAVGGASYRDLEGTPDGVATAKIAANKAKIVAKGAHAYDVAAYLGRNPVLPSSGALRVQFQTSTGVCLDSVFSTATRNDGTVLSARGD